jgi:hypothetical protein
VRVSCKENYRLLKNNDYQIDSCLRRWAKIDGAGANSSLAFVYYFIINFNALIPVHSEYRKKGQAMFLSHRPEPLGWGNLKIGRITK